MEYRIQVIATFSHSKWAIKKTGNTAFINPTENLDLSHAVSKDLNSHKDKAMKTFFAVCEKVRASHFRFQLFYLSHVRLFHHSQQKAFLAAD